ncbi:MAG: aminodeoxychorismate synthase component I [Heliobacteriaceae bacterium]|nr:aminodeoxychorismate synthase component I [Heliobacteriaceae bacterium]
MADDNLEAAFARIEELRKKYFLLGYVRYNAASPRLYFEAFEGFEDYAPRSDKTFCLNPKPAVSFDEYAAAIHRIKEEIACGNTYEVNYTYDFDVEFSGDETELYEYLLKKQKTPYNAFIKNEFDTVLSFSPELFFELEGSRVITKPMKGTAARGKTPSEDAQMKDFLANDPKNRAENVMIVDLLRNDLGRIAKTGTVKVTRLFEIETHPTLHQMTSQIEADLADGMRLYDIFKAIFPCGSITGAPKISTMKIIGEVEKGERDIYCGAIGFLSPEKAVFSVPIRILQRRTGSTVFKYRVGGAIVWDSDVQDEWLETVTKTRFLSDDFQLIETMLVENNKILFEAEHLERLRKSAEHYGFKYNPLSPTWERDRVRGIIRILLNKDGQISVEHKELTPVSSTLKISPLRTDREEFLFHKTTYRPYYSENAVFFNKQDELTETSIANIVLEIDGKWYTPPAECGLLNGIYRQKLLHEGKCEEKILYLEDLKQAQRIFCVNSVRGLWEVEIDFN